MKLVNEWKQCWKWFSVQANAIGASIAVGYVSMYEQLKENFPPTFMMAITALVFMLGVFGRILDQSKK